MQSTPSGLAIGAGAVDLFNSAARKSPFHCDVRNHTIAHSRAREEHDEPFAPRDTIAASGDRLDIQREALAHGPPSASRRAT